MYRNLNHRRSGSILPVLVSRKARRYTTWVGRRDAPHDDRYLSKAGVVPVQSMDAFTDLQSKPRTLQFAIFNDGGGVSVEEKARRDNIRVGRVVTEELDAFVGS